MTHSYYKQTPDEANLLAPEKVQRVDINEAVLNHDIDQNSVAVNKRQFESFDARQDTNHCARHLWHNDNCVECQ